MRSTAALALPAAPRKIRPPTLAELQEQLDRVRGQRDKAHTAILDLQRDLARATADRDRALEANEAAAREIVQLKADRMGLRARVEHRDATIARLRNGGRS